MNSALECVCSLSTTSMCEGFFSSDELIHFIKYRAKLFLYFLKSCYIYTTHCVSSWDARTLFYPSSNIYTWRIGTQQLFVLLIKRCRKLNPTLLCAFFFPTKNPGPHTFTALCTTKGQENALYWNYCRSGSLGFQTTRFNWSKLKIQLWLTSAAMQYNQHTHRL